MKKRSESSSHESTGTAKPGKAGKPDRRKRPDQRQARRDQAADSGQSSKQPPAQQGKPRRARKPPRGQASGVNVADTPVEELKPQPARMHKVMAAAGLGSRRALEQEIRAGAVQLNGTTATLGQPIKLGDRLQWNEREWLVVDDRLQHRTLVYNKPEGEITSRSDPEGRSTVFDRLPQLKGARWVAVGRLDINTTGLLLLTTDGELANAMMHPSSQVDREYVCRVRGTVSDEQLAQLKEGVMLDDGPAHFNDVTRMGGPSTASSANQWYQATLLEGRNREVRRLWESMDHMVSRLKRVRYGAALLPKGLKVGQWHELSAKDHQVLREDVSLAEASPELNLHLVSNRQHTDNKNSTRSSRARGKRNAGPADGRKPRAAGKGGRTAASGNERSTIRSSDRERPDNKKGAAGRVADKQRNSKPGSPAGGGRRPGSKPRRGDR